LKELLSEYRQTLKETRSLLASIDKKIKESRNTSPQLEEDKKIVNSWISNLQYSIKWLSTGKRPGSKRGIERRSVYQKEILIDGMEIAKVIDNGHIYYPEEESIESEEEQVYFEKVTNSILDVLTEKERELYKMHLNGLAPFEISKYMGMPYKTVYKSINRCKEKIRNEDVSFL